MKKFFKIACFAIATVTLLACLFACDGLGLDGLKSGKYYFVETDENGKEFAHDNAYIEILGSSVFAIVSEDGQKQEGTYSAKDGTVTFTINNDSQNGTFSDDRILLGNDGGALVRLTDEALVKFNARTIEFDALGGSAVPSVNSVIWGEINAPTEIPVKKGYIFAGWSTDALSEQIIKFPYTVEGDATLYAKWKPDKGGVKYFNGGTINNGVIQIVTDETKIVFDTVRLNGENTTWKLFADKKGTEEIPDKTVGGSSAALKSGNNVFYVVTYVNGEKAYEYELLVHKRQLVKVRFYDGETLICEKEHTTYSAFADDFTVDIEISGKEITAWRDENGSRFVFGKDGDVIEAVKEIKNESGQIIGYAADFYADTEPKTYTINYVTDGGVVVRPFASVRFGEEFALEVPTKTGSEFEYWYAIIDGVKKQITDRNGRSMGNYSHAGMMTVYAEWTLCDYEIEATAGDNAAGSVTGGGLYPYGSAVKLIAVTNKGYTWLGWFDLNDELVNNNKEYELTVGASDAEYVAKWAKVTAKTNKPDAGTAETIVGEETLVPGNEIKLSAKSNKGFVWLGWYNEEGVKVNEGNSNEITVTVPDHDAVYTAKWAKVTLAKNIDAAGDVGGLDKDYVVGDETKITATTNENYQWVGWYRDNERLSDGAETDLTIKLTDQDVTYTAKWKLFTVTLLRNDENAGTIIDLPETYLPGDRMTITADTNEGYTFIGWFERTITIDVNGNESISDNKVNVGTRKDYTFTMPEKNVTYVAKWSKVSIKQVLVGATGNENEQEEQGKAAGEATLTSKSSGAKSFVVNETAVAKVFTTAGYTWLGWYEGETKVSEGTLETYEFAMTKENRTLIAKWSRVKLVKELDGATGTQEEIDAATDKAGKVHFSKSDKSYIPNEKDNAYAETNVGYTWLGWYENDKKIEKEELYNVTMTNESRTLVAKWSKVTLASNSENAGKVPELDGKYREGDTVSVVAETADGYTFIGWYSGDEIVTDKTFLEFKTEAQSMTYEARWIKVSIAINDENAGSTSALNGKYLPGDECEVTAVTNSGYTFLGWFNDGKKVTGDKKLTFSMPSENRIYEAKWSKTVAVSANEKAGTVTELTDTYVYGQTVTIKATTNSGYVWQGWFDEEQNKVSEGVSLEYTFVMGEENRTFTAKWSKVLVVTNDDNGGTTDQLNDRYHVGQTVRTNAYTHDGYTFLGWYCGDEKVSKEGETAYSLTLGETDVTLEARWQRCKTVISVNDANAGTISGVEEATVVGRETTIEAKTNDGYTFIGWFLGNNKVSEDLRFTYTFKMTANDVEYVAKWRKFPVTFETNDAYAGSTTEITGATIVGQELSVKATTNPGYTFVGWYNGEQLVGAKGEETFTFTLGITDTTYTAKWIRCPVTLEKNIVGAGGVSGTEGATKINSDVTIIANSNPGYVWLGWYENDVKLGIENSFEFDYTFTMTEENRTLTAKWAKIEVVSTNEAAGSVSVEEKAFTPGDDIVVNAQTNDGYTFIGWYIGETNVESATRYVFTAENKEHLDEIKAKWIKVTLNSMLTGDNDTALDATLAGEIGGLDKPFITGEIATITAVTNDGYTFVGWYDNKGKVSADGKSEYSFAMPNKDAEYTAKWIEGTINAEIELDCETAKNKIALAGNVSGAEKSNVVGEKIVLSAETNVGYAFLGWYEKTVEEKEGSEAVINYTKISNDFELFCKIIVTETKRTFVAKFAFIRAESKLFSHTGDKSGTVSGVDATYFPDDEETVVASNAGGFTFLGWYTEPLRDNETSTRVCQELTYTFTVPDKSMAIYARWTERTVDFQAKIDGKIAANFAQYLNVPTGITVAGKNVTISAAPVDGYVWLGWYEDNTLLTKDRNYTFPMPDGENQKTYSARWATKTLSVAVIENGQDKTASPSMGRVTGLENAVSGQDVTLYAETYDNATFTGWYDVNNKLLESGYSYTVRVPEAALTIKAKWIDCPITIGSYNPDAGTTGSLSAYKIGDTVVLSAKTNEGYTFLGWYEGETKVSEGTSMSYSFTLTETKRTIIPRWIICPVTVSVDEKYIEGGNAIGIEDIATTYGEQVTVYASTNDGYTFFGWFLKGADDAPITKELEYTFTLSYTDKYELIAKWKPCTISVKAIPAGAVSVTQQTIVGGKATITAAVNSAYTWVGWLDESGMLVGDRAYSVEVDVPGENTASYTAKWITCPITLSTEGGGGTVMISENTVATKQATITAVSKSGYKFVGWFDKDENLLGARAFSLNVTVPESDSTTYTAKWTKCNVSASAVVFDDGVYSESSCGRVEINGGTVDVDTVTMTAATTENGFVFLKWVNERGEDVSSDYSITVKDEQGKTYRAVWINNPIGITRNVVDAGSTSVVGTIEIGKEITLRAALNEGYVWLGWYKGTEIITEQTDCNVTVTEENVIYTATWCVAMPITVKKNISAAGTVTDTLEQVTKVGDKATIAAETNDGYAFIGWFNATGTMITSEPTYELTVTKDPSTYEARWLARPVIAESSEQAAGVVRVSDITRVGQQATLTAETNDGYTFVGWFKGETLVNAAEECEIIVEETPVVYTAKWIKFPVTINRNDENAGSVVGVPLKTRLNQVVTVTAETNDGYTFVGWFNKNEQVSKKGEYDYTFKITENAETYEARWVNRKFDVTTNDETAGRAILPRGGTVVGGKVTLEAETNDGYVFDGWYLNEKKIAHTVAYEVEVTLDYKVYTAKWVPKTTIALEKNIEQAGEVRASDLKENSINLYATINDGYTFIGWYNGETLISGAPECKYDIPETTTTSGENEPLTLTAKWIVCPVSVIKNVDEAGETNSIVGGTVLGQKITLAATTRKGYAFVGWYANDVLDPNELGKAVREFTITEETVVYEARWMVCPVTVVKSSDEAGDVSGVDGINIGDEITLAATTRKGYTFVGWYNGDKLLAGGGSTMTYVVTRGKKEFIAVWSRTVIVTDNAEGGTVRGMDGTYVVGEETTIVAERKIGYLFDGWFVNGIKQSDQADYVITLTRDDVVYIARFSLCNDHKPDENCICTKCGAECHNMDIYCTCIVCGKTEHDIEDCVCKKCGTTVHEVDENCVCRVCGREVHGSNALGYCMHDDGNDKQKVYFGSYPQTEVKGTELIARLNAKITDVPTASNSGSWTSYKVKSWTTNEQDYMWYNDVVYGNDRYRGVYFTSYRPTSSTKSVSQQQNNGYVTKKIYWFKYELIEWQVLSSNGTLASILSKYVLDSQEYSVNNNNSYMNSSIRAWLNDAFYNRAFGSVQKKNIKVSTVDNSKESAMNEYANVCENTRDNVYLLSRKELNMYAVGSKQYTDYAKIMGIKINYEANAADRLKCEWWTRSPFGGGYDNAAIVKISGLSNSPADVTQSCTGVVPTVKIRLK